MKQQHWTHTILLGQQSPLAWLGLAWLGRRLEHATDRPLTWLERVGQRRRLHSLDERMLRDIGVSRAAASAETDKWFWQA
jgi:uncharacterized protein YjiS (DUF1127 family)